MDGAGVTEWLGHAARRLQEEAQCAGAEGGNGTAVNPNVFENDVGQLVGTSLLCFVVTCLAVAAGIGGGGLLVPLYAFVLGLGPKNAVPVSKATIFGVAIGNVFFIGRERHPKAIRPLIDYSTAVFMQGGELAGVFIGVLFNQLLSDMMITILLAVVLSYNAYKTLRKAVDKFKKETKAFAAEKAAAPASKDGFKPAEAAPGQVELTGGVEPTPETKPPSEAPSEGEAPADAPAAAPAPAPAPAKADVEGGEDASLAERRAILLKEEATQYPLWAWIPLLIMATFTILYSFLISGYFDPTMDNCHESYWGVYILPFIFYGGCMLFFAWRNMNRHKLKEEIGFEFADGAPPRNSRAIPAQFSDGLRNSLTACAISHGLSVPSPGDIKWTRNATLLMVPAAVGAGVAAGLLGIGGGMILGPLFVALNFQPQVGTATTGFMILFTAFGGTVKYVAVGRLPWQYLLWFGGIGIAGGQTGQRVVKKLLAKTGRPSLVVFILGSIIALAVTIMTASGIINGVNAANTGANLFCFDLSQFICDPDAAGSSA